MLLTLVVVLATIVRALAAFVEPQTCNFNVSQYKFEKFVVDAALDERRQRLKFVINTKVMPPPGRNRSSQDEHSPLEPMVTDVNTTTNMFTTFRVEIEFMGKTFIQENLRLCDMLVVKNTSESQDGPRYVNPITGVPYFKENLTIPSPMVQQNRTGNLIAGPKKPGRDLIEKESDRETERIIDHSPHVHPEHPGHPDPDHPGHREGIIFGGPPDPFSDLEIGSLSLFMKESRTSEEPPFYTGLGWTSTSGPNRFVGQPPSLATSNSSIDHMFHSGALGCPLYKNDSVVIYYEADVSKHFHRLGSYTVRFSIVSNSALQNESGVIGCNKFYVTPQQPLSVTRTLVVGVITLLVATLLINCWTIVYSSYQESSNPFLVMASTICNQDLLRQLESTVPRIIVYLQFALFVGGLDLQYPGFYQPLIGQIKWCALLGLGVIRDSARVWSSIHQDNIYGTYNVGGLKTLTVFASNSSIVYAWQNFIICLVLVMCALCCAQQLFILLKFSMDKLWRRYQWHNRRSLLGDEMTWGVGNNVCALAGSVLNCFLVTFGMPFLVLTSFMFFSAGQSGPNHDFVPDSYTMRQHAYSMTTDYDALLVPGIYFTVYNQTDGSLATLTQNQFNITQSTTNTTADPRLYVMRHDVKNGGVPVVNLVFGSILFGLWISLMGYVVGRFVIEVRGWRVGVSRKIVRLYGQVKTILLWYFLYHAFSPEKVPYMIFEACVMLVKSLVIGCLQSHGIAQVVLLILLEFATIVSLIICRPYYGRIGWVSPIWTLPAARFLVTFLNVAYIKELDLSESSRTYVSYVQLMIHVVCALVFISNMLFVFGKTIVSIWSPANKEPDNYSNKGYVFDNESEFEYKPGLPVSQAMLSPRKKSSDDVSSITDTVFDDEDLYFRASSARPVYTEPAESVKDEDEFLILEKFSKLRRQTTDYRVREGDYIYRKYFVGDEIDPEVKELWDSREKERKEPWFRRREKGFQVDRPRKLVVKQQTN